MNKTTKVILIVVAVIIGIPILLSLIGAFYYFGAMDTGNFLPDSCILDGNLICQSYVVRTNEVGLNIKNEKITEPISLTQIHIKERNTNEWCKAQVKGIIEPGQDLEVMGSIDLSSCAKQSDQKQIFELMVLYTKGTSQIEHVASGQLTTMVRN